MLHGFRVFDRDFHQVFSPENIPFENFTHLPDHFLPDPWNVHLFGDVGERKVSNSGIPGSLRRLQMPGCAASPLRTRLGPGKLMAHMDKDIAAPDEPHKILARTRVSGIGKGSFRSFQTKAETFKIGLSMGDGYDFQTPILFIDHCAMFEDLHLRRRALSRRSAATGNVSLDTWLVSGSRDKIRIKDSTFPEKKIRHLSQMNWPIDLDLRNPACRLIPSRQYETGIIETMIVVKMGEEEMRNPRDVDSCLQQAMKSAWTMVENNHVLTGFHQTT